MTDQRTHAPVAQPGVATKGKKPRKRGRLRPDHVNLMTAVVGLVAVVVGLVGGGAAGVAVQRESSRDAKTTLETENQDLRAQVSDLDAQVESVSGDRDTWKQRAEEAEKDPVDPDPGGTDDPPPTTSLPTGSTYLTELEPVTSRWSPWKDLNIDGTDYIYGLRTGFSTCYAGQVLEAEYSISRRYETFEAVAGISEDSPPGRPVKLEIFADDRLVHTALLNVGQPVELDLDVSDVLRLKFVATQQFDRVSGCDTVYAALGDPVLR